MNIYLDMDDVLCDTAGAYLALLAREFGLHVTFEEVFSFNLQKSFGLDDAQSRHLFDRAHKPDFILALKPLEGMRKVLRNWEERGFSVSILTGRHTSAADSSRQWLEEWKIPYHSFAMVDKYNWSGTDEAVAISLAQLSCMQFDIGVEDSPKMADYLSREMALPLLLFDRPWNRSYEPCAKSRRCRGWQQVETAVNDWLAGAPPAD